MQHPIAGVGLHSLKIIFEQVESQIESNQENNNGMIRKFLYSYIENKEKILISHVDNESMQNLLSMLSGIETREQVEKLVESNVQPGT